MKLYRYEIEYRNYDGDTQVRLREFQVVRETDRSYFIPETDYVTTRVLGRTEKRIRKNAINTYAYDTKEKAKEHFIRRTKKRIEWFDYWTEECKKALMLIENYEND